MALNGSIEIKGDTSEHSAAYVWLATTLTLQTPEPLAPGETADLQGNLRVVADGAADHTSFWGCKVG